MRTINGAFMLLTIAVAAALLLPMMLMKGMFMDGMLYSVVAHNQANGLGTFWEPRFSLTGLGGLETFHEHPPLTFGMQALWFKMLGSAFWVEKAYAVLTAVITACLMIAIWRTLIPADRPERKMIWFPLLLWIIIPTVYWCYNNNMQENTMGMFTAAAVLCTVRARQAAYWSLTALAGVMVFLATMAKGLPGLFPLAAPLLLGIILRDRPILKPAGASLLMFAVVVICYLIIIQSPDARHALTTHVEQRMLHRIAELPTVEHRLATLEMLFSNMAGPLVITILILYAAKRWGKVHATGNGLGRPALAMAAIGISGVLPLMLTMVQKSFYMAAALPFLALALALWCGPALQRLLKNVAPNHQRMIGYAGIIGIIGVVVTSVILHGNAARDEDVLHDVEKIASIVPGGTVAGVEPALWNDWNLQGYLMRYHFISLTDRDHDRRWFLTSAEGTPPMGFEEVSLGLRKFSLWQKEGSDQ